MSYELYFLVPEERDAVSIDEFAAYFGARFRCRVDGAQAIYRNEDTGVAFVFDYVDPEGDVHEVSGFEDDEGELEPLPADGWKPAHVSASVNYLRPHVLGLEAAPEIEAFVEAFDLSIDDPQTDGMGRGAFTTEGFLRGWNEGNQFAYHAAVQHFLENNAGDVHTLPALPTAEIERHWRWNRAVEALQARLGEDVFVPSIRYVRDRDGVRSIFVWTDAIPTAFPRTDLVALERIELAPRRGLLRRKRTSVSVVPYDEVLRALDRTRVVTDHVEQYQLFDADEPPASVRDLFEFAPPITGQPEGVGANAVLNQELLVEAMRAAETKDA